MCKRAALEPAARGLYCHVLLDKLMISLILQIIVSSVTVFPYEPVIEFPTVL